MAAKLLVTGACGFVGRHLLERAAARGCEVVAFDGDARDAGAVRDTVAAVRPGAVVHLASTPRSADAVSDDLRMATNVIESAGELAPSAPVLVPGSAAQYGEVGGDRAREDAPLCPLTPYGAAKCALERAVLSRAAACGVRIIFTRSFNHLGPGQGQDAPVAAWARQVAVAESAGGGRVQTGRLDVERDFLDVRDVADAYLDLALSEASGVVNVCSGRAVVLADVARVLLGLSNAPISLETDPALVRAVDPPRVVGDPSRLFALTGFRPQIPLERSISELLDEQRLVVSPPAVVRNA